MPQQKPRAAKTIKKKERKTVGYELCADLWRKLRNDTGEHKDLEIWGGFLEEVAIEDGLCEFKNNVQSSDVDNVL